jgi:hypothetical protein
MTDQTADALVAEARRAVHESLTLLPAWDADRVRALIADLEAAVESRTAIQCADRAVRVPAVDRAAPVEWIDGHPRLEAIAAAVWERCEHHDSGLVIDDPRNIAVAALAALPAPVDQAAVLREAADDLATAFGDPMVKHIGALGASHLRRRAREIEGTQPAEPRRMAGEAQPAGETPVTPVQHAPGKAIRCPDCRAKSYAVCLNEPAAGARQDGAVS